jgi:PAS domain S-box-containing protein
LLSEPKTNILIVDDSPKGLFALKSILENEGYNIIEGTSGTQALRLLLDKEFAVILLDVVMPGMDGFETAKIIRERKKTHEVPIIFVTAFSHEEAQIFRGYSLGAVDYILTPVIPEILRAKVSVFVELFRKTEQVRQQSKLLQAAERQKHETALREKENDLKNASLLRISEARCKRLADATFEGIAIHKNGKIVDANRSFAKMYGYSLSELIGKTLSELTTEKYRNFILSQALSNDERPFEKAALRKDGTTFPAEVSAKLLPTKENSEEEREEDRLRVLAVRDISERKLSEELKRRTEKLTRSNEELEKFACIASHDLKEPLRMVANYLALLGKKCEGKLDGDAKQFINFAIDGAKRMQVLIDDLLTYSHAATKPDDMECTDCNIIVKEVLVNLENTIERNGAVIHVGKLPEIKSTRGQLARLFQNLISNAIKYRKKENPEISIEAKKDGAEWVFSIKDNGIGLEMEYAEQIFVMFRRLHNREKYPGTGIGLATCKKIIESHGGRIWVESKPDEGSTFFFTIPDPSAKLPLQGMRILLVDDSEDMELFVGRYLLGELGGASVDVANNGELGIEMGKRGAYDLILMDIQMPLRNGFEATEALRRSGFQRPIVAFTGQKSERDKEVYLTKGFTDFLSKDAAQNVALDFIARFKKNETALRA